MNSVFAIFLMLLAVSLHAAPAITAARIVQESSNKAVISFTLTNEPAIVTIDIQTNVTGTADWVTIGANSFTNLVPNINGRRLAAGDYSTVWNCRSNWPDMKVQDGGLRAAVTAYALDNPPDYMAVDLTTKSNIVFYASADTMPYDVTNDIYKTDILLMKRMRAAGIPWRMGSSAYCSNRGANEVPVVVTLSEDYYIAVFTFTELQYRAVYPAKPGHTTKKPYTLASYDDLRGTVYSWPAEADGHKVSDGTLLADLRSDTGLEFDLPTGCQWEFACRGGLSSYYLEGSDTAIRNADNETTGTVPAFTEYAWARITSARTDPGIHEVGLLKPNGYGLYDMIGNIWEWCLDWQPVASDFTGEPLVDYPGPVSGTYRMARGGSSASTYSYLSSASKRINFSSTRVATDTGFRPTCPAKMW